MGFEAVFEKYPKWVTTARSLILNLLCDHYEKKEILEPVEKTEKSPDLSLDSNPFKPHSNSNKIQTPLNFKSW